MHFPPLDTSFKNPVAVEIGTLHSQPLKNNNFYFPIIAEAVISQMLLYQPQRSRASPNKRTQYNTIKYK